MLEQEPPDVKQNVRFLCADFIKDVDLDTKYDTVLLTEILEHLEQPKEMVKKASETLHHGGKMIVTVPFGINDFPDHKQTFYMANISTILSEWVQIDHVEYMDEWIGFCCTKSDHVSPIQKMDLSLVLQEEKCFFALERPLRDELKAQQEHVKKLRADYETMKAWLEEEKEKSDRLQERGKKLKADYETMKVWFEEEKRKRQEQEKQLIDARKLSEEYEAVRQECKKLRKERDSYAEKYSLLANAKLGKLTIKYWETKKHLFTK